MHPGLGFQLFGYLGFGFGYFALANLLQINKIILNTKKNYFLCMALSMDRKN